MEMVAEKSGSRVKATISVEKREAERVREFFLEECLFDPDRSIARDDKVHFPALLKDPQELAHIDATMQALGIKYNLAMGIECTKEREGPYIPFERLEDELQGILPRDLALLIPDRWEKLGDALLLDLDERLLPWKREIGAVYAKELRARFVLLKKGGVRGEFREPSVSVLVEPPDGSYRTRHRENGVLFELDPRCIMFSPGNVDERISTPIQVNEGPRTPREMRCISEGVSFDGEVVLDMFAGIGYFSLPIAVHAPVKRVVSVEKNPVAFGYLSYNIRLNGQERKVVPLLGDNRATLPHGIADRVLMGYVGGTIGYLGTALSCLRPEGGIVHFHDTVPVELGPRGLSRTLSEAVSNEGMRCEVLSARKVKSYAPRIVHAAVDLRIGF